MKTLDQLGAEILAAIDTVMGDTKHKYTTVMVHEIPEELFTSGEMIASGEVVYFRQKYYPGSNTFPSVTFFSENRPPTQQEYEATKNTEPITGEELPF